MSEILTESEILAASRAVRVPAGELAAFGLAMEEATGKISALSLKLGRVRELAESWTGNEGDGWGPPTSEMRTEADCGREILAIIGTPGDGDA